jgi:hypothetical protein
MIIGKALSDMAKKAKQRHIENEKMAKALDEYQQEQVQKVRKKRS